jgi:hypothetical protein
VICHKKKVLFVHCHKCAGNSISSSLFGRIDEGFNGDPFEGSPEKHASVNEYVQRYGEGLWEAYFTFSFVRNPWDRVISWIKYRRKRRKLYGGEIDSSVIKREMESEYLLNNTYYNLLSLDSTHAVDFIGRFENLQADFDTVCDKIGMPRQELPRKNKTKHRHYTEYYNDETREIVAKKYAKDIRRFGYEFAG